ncbi:RICIN domain-containing protein [Kitasatospora sp. NPDC004240]
MRLRDSACALPAAVGLLAMVAPATPVAAATVRQADVDVPDGVYTLSNALGSGPALLDVESGSTDPGTPILLWHTTGGANQQWVVTPTPSGVHTLRSANSGLCLDGSDPQGTTPPVRLVQNTCDGGTHQQWKLQAAGDGTFTLVNTANGLLADAGDPATGATATGGTATGDPAADGTAVVQRPPTGTANQRWKLTRLTRVGTYSAGMQSGGQDAVKAEGYDLDGRTVRMVAHTSVAGGLPRVRLSNVYGTAPLTVGAVGIARQGGTAGTEVAGTHRTVTFDGATTVTIPAGRDVFSDPVWTGVGADQDVLVSVHLPDTPSGADTWHRDAQDTTWIGVGDHVADQGTADYARTTDHWFVLAGLDVMSSTATGTVVVVGDSITDGAGSTWGANRRWPDGLGRRMAAASGGAPRGVVGVGISFNRVLSDTGDGTNKALVSRFGYDVLGQPGVREVILVEGINDIGNDIGSDGSGPLTAADLEAGMRKVIDQAHSAGVRIIGGTIPPYQGAHYYTARGERIRAAVNRWIRTGGAFDGVVDFDAALRSTTDPLALDPAYDTGDHLHPNDAGLQAMANAVDLGTFVSTFVP